MHVKGLAGLVVCLSLAACAGATEWQTFSSEAGNFSVRVPGEFVTSENTTATSLGSIESHAFNLEHDGYRYSITYTDYPVPEIAPAHPIGALEGEVRRAADSHRVSLDLRRDLLLDPAQGIEFRGTLLDGQEGQAAGKLYGRVYLFRSRIYRLIFLAPPNQSESPNADEFLSSFRWLNPNAPVP